MLVKDRIGFYGIFWLICLLLYNLSHLCNQWNNTVYHCEYDSANGNSTTEIPLISTHDKWVLFLTESTFNGLTLHIQVKETAEGCELQSQECQMATVGSLSWTFNLNLFTFAWIGLYYILKGFAKWSNLNVFSFIHIFSLLGTISCTCEAICTHATCIFPLHVWLMSSRFLEQEWWMQITHTLTHTLMQHYTAILSALQQKMCFLRLFVIFQHSQNALISHSVFSWHTLLHTFCSQFSQLSLHAWVYFPGTAIGSARSKISRLLVTPKGSSCKYDPKWSVWIEWSAELMFCYF